MTLFAALLLGAALLPGCSSQGLGNNSNCDYLVLPEAGTNGTGGTTMCTNDDVFMDFKVNVVFRGPEAEDGGVGNPPPATTSAQFLLDHYDVTYENLKTHGTVAGVDVPQPMVQSVAAVFDMTSTEELSLTGYPIMLSGAKQQPPLNNSAFFAGNVGVPFEATLTWWGHPVTDNNAWCYGVMHWTFTVAPC